MRASHLGPLMRLSSCFLVSESCSGLWYQPWSHVLDWCVCVCCDPSRSCRFLADPWPHKVDWPRRIINAESVGGLAVVLKEGGLLHVATDFAPYAEWTGEVLREAGWEAVRWPEGSALVEGWVEGAEQAPAAGGEGPKGAEARRRVLAAGPVGLSPAEVHGLLPSRPGYRPVTTYEAKGVVELGHGVYDLVFRRPRPRGQGVP
jgi:tRNA G46 methylase TrmB